MSNFKGDELDAPSWLNDQFFCNILKKFENTDKISVKKVDIFPATVKGDHFASVMFRVIVKYEKAPSIELITKSMIVKMMPQEDGFVQDLVKDTFVFETEIGMYSKTIPQFEKELRKVGDNTVLGAKALYWSLEPHKVIVLEDICPEGYTIVRERMANMDETKIAFLKLSKWHAVSYKLFKEGDKDVTSYCESFWNKKDIESIPFVTSGIGNLIEKLETLDEFQSFVPHLKKVEKNLVKKCIASGKSLQNKSSEGIFALSHGDFHARNIMIKRNKNDKLEDVMLVDFQLCSFSPAILDLINGIYMLCDPQLRLNTFEELFYFYCSNFIETLEKMNFQGEIPTVADFYMEMYRHRHYEVLLLCNYVPMWYALLEKRVDDLHDVLTVDEKRKEIYDYPEYLEDLRTTLPRMLYRGYFE